MYFRERFTQAADGPGEGRLPSHEGGDGLGECRPVRICSQNRSAEDICVLSDERLFGMALTEIDHVAADGRMEECIDNCFEAAQACEWCADECADLDDDMAGCIRLCRDVADVATLHARLMARDSAVESDLARTCAELCEECADECAAHDHDHCRTCADVLRECAESCRTVTSSPV